MRCRRAVSLLLLAACLPACTSYGSTSQSLPELTASPQGVPQLRVTTRAGTKVEMWSPRLMGDTLRGFADPPGERQRVVFVPVSEIQGTEVLKTNAVKTTLAVVGVGALLLGLVGTVALLADPPFEDMTFTY
jgi:hypothetical protein